MDSGGHHEDIPCQGGDAAGFCVTYPNIRCSQVTTCPGRSRPSGSREWSAGEVASSVDPLAAPNGEKVDPSEDFDRRKSEAETTEVEARAARERFKVVYLWIGAALAIVIPVFAMAYVALSDSGIRLEGDMASVPAGVAVVLGVLLGRARGPGDPGERS